MSPRKALLSVLQLFAGFSFFATAIFFFSLPLLPKVCLQISNLLLNSPKVCNAIGTALMAASFVLIGGFYFLSRGRILRIEMGGNSMSIYRNHLKNREFGKEGLQNFCSEQATIAERQDASEDKNYEGCPTQPKTDSSNGFGIDAAVIQKTLEECFKSHFGGQIILSDLYVVRGNKIDIEVCLTPFEENLREELFASVQKQIAPLLSERFGYSKPFGLIVKSF